MKKLHIFIYTLTLLLIAGCERKVDITFSYEGNKLVVNSLIQADSSIYVRVTKSVPVNVYDESAFRELDNVAVKIQDDSGNNIPVSCQQIFGKNYFVSSQKATTGKRYTISASAAGLSPVSGTDTLPAPPQIFGAAAQRTFSRITFGLKDYPMAENYYRIRLFKSDSNGTIQSGLLFRLDPAFNNNVVDIISASPANSLIMNDKRFDGRELTFVLQAQDPLTPTSYLMVEVTTLTYDAYQYLKSVAAQQQNVGDIVSEPVRVYSNILDGYGIVAGINVKRLVFKVD
ncbi:uncharacterized protein DUF4249 [Chitinophaga dinghuensis]|uniref:Uncharacterized protein DUF4249 n=1 Tax=Chitinophaga dinghuensis TaxID=1539050 RepID=A0A327VME0_9BACT|nr:DUF4249 domain-containing protein [Chitinophaga dinghuensis]RAJ75035.1 uncharacterized protein DUF4249 [Chitinophaga dinghuensis]